MIQSRAARSSAVHSSSFGGKIKKGIGKVIGNEQMQADGRASPSSSLARQKANK